MRKLAIGPPLLAPRGFPFHQKLQPAYSISDTSVKRQPGKLT
jgi:hypothetical protein